LNEVTKVMCTVKWKGWRRNWLRYYYEIFPGLKMAGSGLAEIQTGYLQNTSEALL